MSDRNNYPLPVPAPVYDPQNEAVTRRTIELALQELQQTANRDRNGSTANASLAMRRFQFLLAGMS